MSETTEREYVACAGRRPGTFLGKAPFHLLTTFLTRYDQHAGRRGGDRLGGWYEWLIARPGRGCNHAWPGQVLHIALPSGWADIWNPPPGDERRAIEVLFELHDGFAAEREAVQGSYVSGRASNS